MTRIDARIGRVMAAMLLAAAPVGAMAAEAPSESDLFLLGEAESACKAADFSAFLWPFANSRAVRERYSAPNIVTGTAADTRAVPADRYLAADDFPVVMIDYSYVTGASARQFEASGGDARQLVYVEVDFSTPSKGIERADWVPGRFEPGEGDGPGTLLEKTGPGGYLQFRRVGDCWQLTGDIRNPARAR